MHSLRKLTWGHQYRTQVIVSLGEGAFRVCDASFSTTHADGYRDFGCGHKIHFSLADAITAIDKISDSVHEVFSMMVRQTYPELKI